MPQSVTQFDIVISAPNDLLEDVRHLENSIKLLNNSLASRGIIIRPKHWSHSTIPGKGTEGQEVVRRQLIDTCDVLVALIGKRLGTRTLNHESGTVDEILNMSDKDGSLFGGHHVQIYFKDENVSINDIDIDELLRVRNFKQEVQRRGFYHGSYSALEEISSTIVSGIIKSIENYISNSGKLSNISKSPPDEIADVARTIDAEHQGQLDIIAPGYLDLNVKFFENLSNTTTRFDKFTKVVEGMTADTAVFMENFQTEKSMTDQLKLSNEFATKVKSSAVEINHIFAGAEIEFFDSISAIRQIMVEYYSTEGDITADEATLTLLSSMNEVAERANESAAAAKSVRSTIDVFPNISTQLKGSIVLLSVSFLSMQKFSENCSELITEAIEEIGSAIVKNKKISESATLISGQI